MFLAAVLGSGAGGHRGRSVPAPADHGTTPTSRTSRRSRIPGSRHRTAFEGSAFVRRIFESPIVDNLVMTKRQELHYMTDLTPRQQIELYLDTV
jgi:glutamine synthetase